MPTLFSKYPNVVWYSRAGISCGQCFTLGTTCDSSPAGFETNSPRKMPWWQRPILPLHHQAGFLRELRCNCPSQQFGLYRTRCRAAHLSQWLSQDLIVPPENTNSSVSVDGSTDVRALPNPVIKMGSEKTTLSPVASSPVSLVITSPAQTGTDRHCNPTIRRFTLFIFPL